MAHWINQTRLTADDVERVAVFEMNHHDLDLLTAFYQDAVDPSDESNLAVGDLIEVSRLFAMIARAADWTDPSDWTDPYEEQD